MTYRGTVNNGVVVLEGEAPPDVRYWHVVARPDAAS